MRKEITQICRDGDCVDKRIDQLKKFRNYLTMNDVARVMVDLKETYDMKGNFGPFENMQSHKNEDLAFKDFEESLSEVGDLLEGITQERIISLQAFIQSHKLVKWLNDSMKEFGLKEFIVFVDLATISAGESTEKMAMVKSLHAGVIAYSPLIFDMSRKDDYRDVIQKCQKVWETLEESPNINESLVFANQHLEWFKHVKNTKGVVEVTSFMEANAINDFGIFTIGKNAGTHVQNGDHDVTSNTALSHVIKLTVPADRKAGRIEAREYSLSELEELQSKLILVAGEAEKGQACVERFSMVLDGVIRLSQVYIRLVSSGCVIFTNFAIKLFCEPNLNTPVCVILEFKNGDELTQLKCRKTTDERLENIMPKIASQMEKCLANWITFVNEKRTEYLHLNYYTMDQLVIIQKEIANLCLQKETSPKLFPLLQCVKSDCKKDDVICANQKAVTEIKADRSDRDLEQESSNLMEKEDPKRDKFIKKLVMAKFERLIPFALEKFPNFDISKALTWCMKNKNNVEKFETERKSRLSKTRGDVTDDLATGDTQPTDTFATWMSKAMANEGQYDKCEFMLLKFDRIWQDFIQAIISNLQDFISLKQLGVLLRHLANEEKKKVNRTFPDGYIESSPNLVICSTDEVLQTTLSVYMMGETADDMPLPQSDEVLMCSAKTSLEQVDVFLRRSVFFANGKIHCIVNADLMEFNVCEGLHDLLQEYIRKVGSDVKYRLIIICGSEKEHSLSMISSLEKYRRTPFILDPGRVKTNIQNKLRVDIKCGAASVDFDKSTVRLVQSQRSGVGKTLYKKRREEELKKLKNVDHYEGITLPLHQKKIDIDNFIGRLLRYTEGPDFSEPRLFHIDLTHESTFTNSKHQMLNFLPSVVCRSPQESVTVYQDKEINGYVETDQLFDEVLYNSDLYQKPYMFLRELRGQTGTRTSIQDCLEILLGTCRVNDPSWSELYHFVSFLHTQIIDFDKNYFVSQAAARDFPGFRTFVRKCLLQMSKDFSSRSLNMSEESDVLSRENDEIDELEEYQMKRTWESSPHPYLFFNADHNTFTFIGFNIEAKTKKLVDIQSGEVLEEKAMDDVLYRQLKENGVPIQENFDKLSR
ncbi:E3 ubiquitin-protein ligase rnf213-alpha-like [Ruditapes philippinarum]|uniref:E3 ubiquitin-protein ligase rnf213-alpha-like n=1 Tax=Ruditapes philippinarum TaxID=129788 RepID=UPI00295AE800|nr:E3 ubiquitin-protein ligase rnf213-alpha-like [Ruditapes philippinarum]